ncbi:hypothetical protein BaRGS_00031126 [Batillaria attramentaria]|uniref:Uncharacterized protein n=1 Tax=Batillaria attramentaria TaxID=370345 RepID=A0ABD0JS46_9CAEN
MHVEGLSGTYGRRGPTFVAGRLMCRTFHTSCVTRLLVKGRHAADKAKYMTMHVNGLSVTPGQMEERTFSVAGRLVRRRFDTRRKY